MCFQSAHPNWTDLILTNNIFFENSDVLEVRISDHHSFTVAALKSQ